MIFTQFEFLTIFFALLFLLAIIQNNILKKVVILIINTYFYAYLDYRLLSLLFFTTIITYVISTLVNSSKTDITRKIYAFFGILFNLFILSFFKYYNFFIENINLLLGEITDLSTLGILVPIGVSFYTFRFISYLVDIYKGECESVSLLDFLIYGTFFPIIISGPISRARYFLPQLASIRISKVHLFNGYRLFVIGLFLKFFIADKLSPYVTYFYDNYNVFDSVTAWIVVISYSIQIYCDFAGYSSMAIGLSLMMGVRIEDNFNFPYLSQNISDFWRRWHITLSNWIRDYLYIPLGGSRKGSYFKSFNLLIVMALCGLWHGAAWTFIIWGIIHGILLVVNDHWKKSKISSIKQYFPRAYGLLSWLLTFISITLCWVFFRSNDFGQAVSILLKLFSFGDDGVFWVSPFAVFILSSVFITHISYRFGLRLTTLPAGHRSTPLSLFCLLWLVIVFFPKEFQPFVYAQF